MEFVNKIELTGIVGNSNVAVVGDTKVARFSLVTEYMYKGRDNTPMIDTTWFNCTAWYKDTNPALETLTKGTSVSLTGRVRSYRFTMADGTERTGLEVLVSKFNIVALP